MFMVLAGMGLFVGGAYCGRRFLTHIDDEAALREDAEGIEYEFGDSGGDDHISRALIARALLDDLKIIDMSPKREDAYLGATNCYLLLGAWREADNLRDNASRRGLNTKSLDELIAGYRQMARQQGAHPTTRGRLGRSGG